MCEHYINTNRTIYAINQACAHTDFCVPQTLALKYLCHGSAASLNQLCFLFSNISKSKLYACYACSFLTSSAAADETQVVETCHLVLDGGRGVAEFGRIVLIVAGHHSDQRSVRDVTEGNHLSTNEWARCVRYICILKTIQNYNVRQLSHYATMKSRMDNEVTATTIMVLIKLK